MSAPAQDDFKLEVGVAERALKLGSGTLTCEYRAPYAIEADGRRYVWAGDCVRAIKTRFPARTFARLKLAHVGGEL